MPPPGSAAHSIRQLVGLSAAAAYADLSTRTLRRYIAQGKLTGYRIGPRLVKVDLSELDQLARPIPRLVVPDDGGWHAEASGTQLARKKVSPGDTGADLVLQRWAILGSNQ
jgi:excisionase family DNA binding protein